MYLLNFFLETSRRATGVYPAVAMILASNKAEVDNEAEVNNEGDAAVIPSTPPPPPKRKSNNKQTNSNERRQNKREQLQLQNGT